MTITFQQPSVLLHWCTFIFPNRCHIKRACYTSTTCAQRNHEIIGKNGTKMIFKILPNTGFHLYMLHNNRFYLHWNIMCTFTEKHLHHQTSLFFGGKKGPHQVWKISLEIPDRESIYDYLLRPWKYMAAEKYRNVSFFKPEPTICIPRNSICDENFQGI